MNSQRILLLDDDRSLLRAIRLTLLLEGWEVETATDGLLGLEQVADKPFDLVVLDLQMPRLDGRGFFRELRAQGHTMPVVIVSAYGAESARDELDAEGAVSKPFDPDYLVSSIRRLLPAASATEAAG